MNTSDVFVYFIFLTTNRKPDFNVERNSSLVCFFVLEKKIMSNEQLVLKGALVGHNDWVTQIATTPQFPDIVLSASRDKSVLVWQLNIQVDQTDETATCGMPSKALRGHSHFVSDVVISSDGLFAVSSSWDGSLRLWDLSTGTSTRQFVGHKKDVLSVAFSADNRQIVSGSRDKTIKLWNTVGQCRITLDFEIFVIAL